MHHTIKMPVLGDTTKFGVISEWRVSVGERVEVSQPLVVVESDKAIVEVPSPFAGTLIELLAKVDDEIDVGEPIAIIDGTV